MKVSVETAGNVGVYLTWFGCLVVVYDIYPSTLAWFYIGFAVIITAVITGFMRRVARTWERVEGDSELESQFKAIVNNLHIPCGNPKTCERCAGFYWGFAVAGTIATGILSGVISNYTVSENMSYAIATTGFVFFLASVTGHGLLNAFVKMGHLESYDFLVADRMKLAAGFTAGASFVTMGIGISTIYLPSSLANFSGLVG